MVSTERLGVGMLNGEERAFAPYTNLHSLRKTLMSKLKIRPKSKKRLPEDDLVLLQPKAVSDRCPMMHLWSETRQIVRASFAG